MILENIEKGSQEVGCEWCDEGEWAGDKKQIIDFLEKV